MSAPGSPAETVGADDVRRLFDSDLDDPVLVLLAGRPEVIDAGEQHSDRYEGSMLIASRRLLLDQAGGPPEGEPEFQRLATTLSELVDRLGG
jgi:NADH dehydrogenase